MSANAPDPQPHEPTSDANAGIGGATLGFVAGGLFSQSVWGALSGAGIGAALLLWRAASRRAVSQRNTYLALERRVRALESAGTAHRDAPRAPAPDAVSSVADAPARAPTPAPPTAPPPPPAAGPPSTPPTPVPHVEIAPSAHHVASPRAASPFDRARVAVQEFFFGGNTVVRVGILVLLIGVALLAKWAADRALFPVEARLAAAAAIGMVLTGIGYRLREARPGFATTLQGGGVAALYLVVFFAFRAYALVPAGLAFALFVAIAIACGTLAVVQRSQPLIFIGSVGGFLAPVLASTGAGDHVALFGYYLLLDIAIGAVAWRESWRSLNLLAFVCTYGVATTWGVLRYRPEHFATTEPFLLAYLVVFTTVALVQAWRQPPKLAGFVDGTLVFGTPLVTLLAQAQLVEGRQLGMAISTAGFGLYYALLATWVWRRAPAALRRMAEAFVALAVGFGTIAIPLGLDDALTTTLAWSLEGAGIYWVGTRQNRRLARLSGIALQGLAALSFLWAAEFTGFETRAAEFLVVANPRFLSCLAIALAGLFIAREAHHQREHLTENEWRTTQALAGWGLLWWSGGVLADVDQFASTALSATLVLLAIAATFPALERVAARLGWTPGRLWAAAIIPAGFLAIPMCLDQQTHLLANGGVVAWPLVVLAVYFVLARLEACAVAWTRTAYAPALWLAALVVPLGLWGVAETGLSLEGDWAATAFGIGLAAVIVAAGFAVERGVGAFGRFSGIHLGAAIAPAAAFGIFWVLVLNFGGRGDAAPLPYLPLANPNDAAIAMLLLAAVDAWLRSQRASPPALQPEWQSLLGPGLAGVLFLWLNGVLARSVHQWADVPFSADALWDSTPFQASMSICWTLTALAGMLLCTRRGWRSRWIAASTLLGVTVVKLFLVDLSTLSTGARIGTFLVVGALLLVVGYLSPVPPAREGDTALATGDPAGARPDGGSTP
jgi:uncharacterized membrane protein